MVSREPSALPLATSACANTTSFPVCLRWGVEGNRTFYTRTHKHTQLGTPKSCSKSKSPDVKTQYVTVEESHIFLRLILLSRFTRLAHSHMYYSELWQSATGDPSLVSLAAEGWVFINKLWGQIEEEWQHSYIYIFYLIYFIFYKKCAFILAEQQCSRDRPWCPWPGRYSDDTEEMDLQPVKGKSFISVDPLGQVDWSWAFWFGFFFAFSPHRVHAAPAITANREGDGSKILSR